MKSCNCNCVDQLISDPNKRGKYFENIVKLNQWEEDKILELYAGDSYLDKIPEHCEKEDRYTISHYYRCKKCGRVFFIGFSCRGGFIFKVEEFPKSYAKSLNDINFEHIMEGKEKIGIRFNNSKRFLIS